MSEAVTIKAIMFDMGNVLVHFDARKSSSAFAKALGVSEKVLWEGFFISEMEKSYTRGEISSRDFFDQASSHFSPKKMDFDTFAHLWSDIFTENEEISGLLRRLKQHYPLYLISNTNELHFDHIKSKFNVLDHFERCFPSHEVGHRKPDQAMFKHVLNEIKLKPEETVFIDDILDFVEGANQAGIHGVQYTTSEALEKDLVSLGVTI